MADQKGSEGGYPKLYDYSSLNPEICGVFVQNPSCFIFQSPGSLITGDPSSSWINKGKEFPYMKLDQDIFKMSTYIMKRLEDSNFIHWINHYFYDDVGYTFIPFYGLGGIFINEVLN